MYFGGKLGEHEPYIAARWTPVGGRKSKSELESEWLPFYKNLYCRFSTVIDRRDRWPIIEECVEAYAKHKGEDLRPAGSEVAQGENNVSDNPIPPEPNRPARSGVAQG